MIKIFILAIIACLLISLGTASAIPYKDKDIQKIEFVHYKDVKNAKSTPQAVEKCYKTLGYKWGVLPVSYMINPINPDGLSDNFIKSAIVSSTETWDIAVTSNLFHDYPSISYLVSYGVQDFNNAIVFGDYPDNNVIAVTSLWVTSKKKQIVEFDIKFNTRFKWGDATNPPTNTSCTQWEQQCQWLYDECAKWDNITYENGTVEEICVEWQPVCWDWQDVCVNWQTDIIPVMDLQNIATHELGHAVGLDDIYTSTCSEVTMYGYSTYMETKKRTLEQPDIKGISGIYP
jgi:hypothetical protein